VNDLEEVYRDAVTTRLMRRMGHALEHDLKSPVQGIYWALELALKSVSAPGVDEKTRAQVEKAVTMARKELVRLERTSRAFLNDSGISESEGETRIDLSELARETVRHFVTDAAIRNVRLTVDVPAEPVYVVGPRAGVSQAVLTCVLHSLDSVPDGGTAEVALKVNGKHATIEIVDNAGEPVEGQDPFGLGVLGMRIARVFVEGHGGEMKSAPLPGGGRRTTCLRLPVEATEGALAPGSQ
jgi:signal transduction histidine kinase